MSNYHLKIIIKECAVFILIYVLTVCLSYIFKFHFNTQAEAFLRLNILVVGIIILVFSIVLAIKTEEIEYSVAAAFFLLILFDLGCTLLISFLVSWLLKIDFYLTFEIISIIPCFSPLLFIKDEDTFWFTGDEIKNKFNKANEKSE